MQVLLAGYTHQRIAKRGLLKGIYVTGAVVAESIRRHAKNRLRRLNILYVEKLEFHVEKINLHVEKFESHVGKINLHVEKSESHVEKPKSHVEKINLHVEKPKSHVEKPKSHVKNPNPM